MIVVHILFILGMVFFIAFKFFDNDEKVISVKDIQNFYLQKEHFSFRKVGGVFSDNVSSMVSKIDIKETLKNTKYLILKPSFMKESKISF